MIKTIAAEVERTKNQNETSKLTVIIQNDNFIAYRRCSIFIITEEIYTYTYNKKKENKNHLYKYMNILSKFRIKTKVDLSR